MAADVDSRRHMFGIDMHEAMSGFGSNKRKTTVWLLRIKTNVEGQRGCTRLARYTVKLPYTGSRCCRVACVVLWGMSGWESQGHLCAQLLTHSLSCLRRAKGIRKVDAIDALLFRCICEETAQGRVTVCGGQRIQIQGGMRVCKPPKLPSTYTHTRHDVAQHDLPSLMGLTLRLLHTCSLTCKFFAVPLPASHGMLYAVSHV